MPAPAAPVRPRPPHPLPGPGPAFSPMRRGMLCDASPPGKVATVTFRPRASRQVHSPGETPMSKSLFRVKPVEPAPHVDAGEPVEGSLQGEVTLKRTLTAKHLVMLGVGAVIGAGIFVLTGQAAANHAGPAIMLSFVLAGFACALAGRCYAEFAALTPVSGSAYSSSYPAMGEFVAWFIGWCLVLESLFASSTVAVGWSGYLVSFLTTTLNLPFPMQLTQAPIDWNGSEFVSTGSLFNLPAIAIVAAISGLCYVG